MSTASPAALSVTRQTSGGAVESFSSVFSLETHVVADTENFRHANFVAEGQEVTRVLDASQILPEGVASREVASWQVSNLDVAFARLLQLGGRVHDVVLRIHLSGTSRRSPL